MNSLNTEQEKKQGVNGRLGDWGGASLGWVMSFIELLSICIRDCVSVHQGASKDPNDTLKAALLWAPNAPPLTMSPQLPQLAFTHGMGVQMACLGWNTRTALTATFFNATALKSGCQGADAAELWTQSFGCSCPILSFSKRLGMPSDTIH